MLFSGHRDRSGTSDVILGHIAFILALEAIVPSHIRYSSHHSIEIYCIRFTDHYSWAFHRYELSAEHRPRLVESLSTVSSGLRFAATCHTGAYPHPWVHRIICRFSHYLIYFLIFIGHPPIATVFTFGASPHCHFSFGASPHCLFVWGIPPLSFRLGHPPTVIA